MHRRVEHAQRRSMNAAKRYRWTVILPALFVGVAAVTGSRSQHGSPVPNMDLPAFYGVLLWISVAVQFKWNTASTLNAVPIDPIALARGLTRQVYTSCYVLAGARLAQFTIDPPPPGVLLEQSMRVLQPYIGYALPALIMGKAAAYLYMKGCARTAAVIIAPDALGSPRGLPIARGKKENPSRTF